MLWLESKRKTRFITQRLWARYLRAGGFILHYADQIEHSEATVRYLVDGKGSKFTVRAFATGLLSAFGHDPTIAIPDFEGEVLVNSSALEQSTLQHRDSSGIRW